MVSVVLESSGVGRGGILKELLVGLGELEGCTLGQ